MKKVYGNMAGLKAMHVKKLQNLYRRRVAPELLVSPELARSITSISSEIRRQVGLLIDRSGAVAYVLVGGPNSVTIPDLSGQRFGSGRLKGLRLVHTHLKDEGVTDEDLTDLVFTRLDLLAAVTITGDGLPKTFHVAHLLPRRGDGKPYEIMDPFGVEGLDLALDHFVPELEAELSHLRGAKKAGKKTRALLVCVTTKGKAEAARSMEELSQLCASNDIAVAGTMVQHRKKLDSRYLLGRGKLRDLAVSALQHDADLVIFDQELNPGQIRAITDQLELSVIDRTQLILDIFAQRAMTAEGKLQVELAQLKYTLPRLVGKNTALSRLAGGIGGRGPGETKLEIDRRRVRERIHRLEKELSLVQKQRRTRRAKRNRNKTPVISIVGYTNAGKSTLLNTLTHSRVQAEDRLFATLDPTSRRLRFPRDTEVIITDTVGFIQDLPRDLVVAFRATLEELTDADLLLHVIDASSPRVQQQVKSVETILRDLSLDHIPTIRVLNKADLVDPGDMLVLCRRLSGLAVCATDESTLAPLLAAMEAAVAFPSTDELDRGSRDEYVKIRGIFEQRQEHPVGHGGAGWQRKREASG
ncbi:MAG: GTPase HflX [Deltaproteobacteria bacterium]|nr:GTPase HflX [Deltaproteobacteria bacterium]